MDDEVILPFHIWKDIKGYNRRIGSPSRETSDINGLATVMS
jgi:hypothetical protein